MISTFIIIALILAFALVMYGFATEVKQNEVLKTNNDNLYKENKARSNSYIADLHKIADELEYPQYCTRDLPSILKAAAHLTSEHHRMVADIMGKEHQISHLKTIEDKVTRLEGQIKQIEESRDEYVDEYHKTKAELNRFKFPQCHNLVYGQQIVLDHNYAYFRRIDGDAIIVMRPKQTTPQGGSFMLKAMDNKESVISLQDFEAGLVAGTITISPRKAPVMFKDGGEKV